jgi:Fe-S cluster assembly protein SufD
MESKRTMMQEKLVSLYQRIEKNFDNEIEFVKNARKKAIQEFQKVGFPSKEQENWKGTDIEKLLQDDYIFSNELTIDENIDINSVFKCEIHNFETLFFANFNGHTLSEQQSLSVLEGGVVAGSIKQAFIQYPQLMEKYFSKDNIVEYNGLTALNSALAHDGLFIYVPQNVHFETPLQLVNLIMHPQKVFVQTRNLIVLEEGSSLTFLQCDDSLQDNNTLTNSVSEFFIGKDARLDHYKLQNKDLSSVMFNTSFFHMEEGAKLNSNMITFNGGSIRNEFVVDLNGRNANADLSGLYLIDKTQHVDNQLMMRHNAPDCISNQTFKGILDEEASAVFTGHVYVAEGATKTEAYQSNKNILLTDEASIMSKPFLEIYNDDVRCSHGSTTGQIDQLAMFYLQQRGICEKNARMLMMYAFADEVIRKIEVDRLRSRTENMVNKRLRGELSSCDQCILHCKPEDMTPFKIDESLL